MGFEETLNSMRESIRDSLDELASPRSSPSSKTAALKNLERQLATACIVGSDTKDAFLALQHTFECNIPSHLLPWITLSTLRLEGLTSRSLAEGERASEMDELASQLSLSLSLIQGIVLNHEPSKEHLGRKCSLEILLDLLLASRYLPAKPASASTNSDAAPQPSPPHVTSVVLDTLLCILVDSTTALRTLESAGGVHAVVKILKRFGTPREVRMKCLEFLYFYLLDETPSSDPSVSASLFAAAAESTPSTAPATPIRSSKPFIANTPLRPISRYNSSTYSSSGSSSANHSFTDSGTSSSVPSRGSSFISSPAKSIPSLFVKTLRSTSGSSTNSFSSTSSNASSSTAVSSVECSPSPVKETTVPSPVSPPGITAKKSPVKGLRIGTLQSPLKNAALPNTPPISSTESGNRIFSPQPRSLMMLRKEVDYVPLSPKKILVTGVGRPALVATSSQAGVSPTSECNRRVHRKSLSASTAASGPVSSVRKKSDAEKIRTFGTPFKRMAEQSTGTVPEEKKVHEDDKAEKENKNVDWKTLEEKKELLGTMLGNVDALVDGVRKAGIWGLG